MIMVEKRFISAEQLLQDSFELGLSILESNFKPNYIVGVWRGGTPVGIAIQELLDWSGIETDHISIRTSLYSGINERKREVRVHGLNYVVKQIDAEDRLLIVDDVFDTGLSIQAVIHELRRQCRKNAPHDIRVATPYFKPANNKTDFSPHYHVHKTDQWLVFPHELHGLSLEEIETQKPGPAAVLAKLKRWHNANRDCD